MIKRAWLLLIASSILLVSACTPTGEAIENVIESESVEKIVKTEEKEDESSSQELEETESKESQTTEQQSSVSFDGYRLIEVDGGDTSGYREPNVRVDIGFGDREYWGFTNEYGQLVRVVANEIILQDDNSEPVTSDGRYYSDEAKVPGVESSALDEGHVIADSLGGVSNAYNITPQDSIMNRHGDQAYMERTIRDAGGATDFEAIITYADTETHIPSKYKYTYTVRGNVVVDEFENINPDEYNEEHGLTSSESNSPLDSKETVPYSEPASEESVTPNEKLSSVDTDNNERVTIKEAESAGYSMPITSDHWLYQYMDDRDNDGMVGE